MVKTSDARKLLGKSVKCYFRDGGVWYGKIVQVRPRNACIHFRAGGYGWIYLPDLKALEEHPAVKPDK